MIIMTPSSMTPNQMRALCKRAELETYVLRRLSTLNKRSVNTWNTRNEKANRPVVSLRGMNKESLVYMAAALNKCERVDKNL